MQNNFDVFKKNEHYLRLHTVRGTNNKKEDN